MVPTYYPAVRYGGPIYSVHGLCKALVELGHDVHVFTTNVDGASDSDVVLGAPVDLDGVKVWYFPSIYLRRLYWSPPLRVALQQRMGGFELVHLHSVFLWPTLIAARLAKGVHVPYIVSPRGMLVKDLIRRKSRWIKHAWLYLFERYTLEHASMIHLTTHLEMRHLSGFGYHLPACQVIPNGVNEPDSLLMAKVSDDVAAAIKQRPCVLFLGRINWEKGLDRLIAAWRDVRVAGLLIAGNDEEGYLPELRNLVEKSDLKDRVIFLPRSISGVDKEALFASADLYVLPSYSENFGNTVPEAMIRGVPIVVTEEVGAREVVEAANSGLVVKGDELADGVNKLLEDTELLSTMGERGRTYARKYLSWSSVADKMIKEYQRVVLF